MKNPEYVEESLLVCAVKLPDMLDDRATTINDRVNTGQSGFPTQVSQVIQSLSANQIRCVDTYAHATDVRIGSASKQHVLVNAVLNGRQVVMFPT